MLKALLGLGSGMNTTTHVPLPLPALGYILSIHNSVKPRKEWAESNLD